MTKKILNITIVVIALVVFAGLIYLFVYLGSESREPNTNISPSDEQEEIIENIVIDTTNTQLYYLQGEDFNQNNIVVTYSNSNGENYNVSNFDVDFSTFDSSTLGEYTIGVSYNNLSSNFEVEVIDISGLENLILQGYQDTTSLYQSVTMQGEENALEAYFSNEEIYIKGYSYTSTNGEYEYEIVVLYYKDGYLYNYSPSTLTGTYTTATIEEAYNQILISMDSEKTCFENFIYNFIHSAFTEIATVTNKSLTYSNGQYTLNLLLDDGVTKVTYNYDENMRIIEEIVDDNSDITTRYIQHNVTCPLQTLPDNIEWN